MPFTPTEFVNNQAPAVSASQLNKLGGQYQAVVDDIADGTIPVGASDADIAELITDPSSATSIILSETYANQAYVDTTISTSGFDRSFYWDGSRYQPAAGVGIVGTDIRQFYGPVDPRGTTGVVNGPRDIWKKTVTPTLPSTGLAHHYRADSLLGTLSSGAVVTSWNDLVGGSTLTAVGTPHLMTETPSRTYVSFDGVGDAAFNSTMTMTQPSTIFVVARWTETNRANLGLVASNSSSASRNNISNNASGVVGAFSGSTLSSGVTAPLAWTHHAATFNGTSGRIQVGDTVVTGTIGTENRAGFQVARTSSSSTNFAGVDIAEIAVYSRIMTDDEYTYIRNLFKSYYSIA